MVNVICGYCDGKFDVVDKSVRFALDTVQMQFNIYYDVICFINGELASDESILKDKDVLEIIPHPRFRKTK